MTQLKQQSYFKVEQAYDVLVMQSGELFENFNLFGE